MRVVVTESACEYFWRNILRKPEHFAWSGLGIQEKPELVTYVKEFVVLQLSIGGTSYWDPILFPSQRLNDAGLAYLIGRSAAYRAIRAAIDDTLKGTPENLLLREFMNGLSQAAIKVSNVDVALQHLPPEAFGGAYQPGDEFVTSPSQILPQLSTTEMELIRNHFEERIERLESTHPAIASEYPRVFARDRV